MKSIPKNLGTNEERTAEYINQWNSEKTLKNLISNPKPCIFDIGANDGTLLRFYKNRSLNLVGFEPATNLMDDAKIGNTEIINNYFNSNDFIEKFGSNKAKVITLIVVNKVTSFI